MANSASSGQWLAAELVRAAASSTCHDRMAFDATERLTDDHAEAWHRLFLRHAQVFSLGANAPDIDFRDFKNHVLFPADRSWGGAAAKAQCWYRNLLTALQKHEWNNVAYCAGVLSHYVADAVHPLHTTQSVADNDISAGVDFTTLVNFRSLSRLASTLPNVSVVLGTGPDFLTESLNAAAADANRSYGPLIAHFDFARAMTERSAGLDTDGCVIMAEWLARATNLIGAILERAIQESGAKPPVVSLAASVIQAIVALPIVAVSNWRQKRRLRHALKGMAREIAATGHVQSLPDDVRAKRDLYVKQAQAALAAPQGENVLAFDPKRASQPRDNDGEGEADIIDLMRKQRPVEQPRPAPKHIEAEPIRLRGATAPVAPTSVVATLAAGLDVTAKVMRSEIAADAQHAISPAAVGHAAAALLTPSLGGAASNFRDRRAVSTP